MKPTLNIPFRPTNREETYEIIKNWNVKRVMLRVTKVIRTSLKVGYFGAFHPIRSCQATACLHPN